MSLWSSADRPWTLPISYAQDYIMTEYLRMSGIYWGLTVMDLMHSLDKMNKEEVLSFVKSCHHDCGGFSASIGHDPHLLYTLSAIQVKGLCSLFSFFRVLC